MNLPKSMPVVVERGDYKELARILRRKYYRQNGNGWYKPLGERDYPRAHLSVDGRYKNRVGFNLHVDIVRHRTSDQHYDFIQLEYVAITEPLDNRNRSAKHGKGTRRSERIIRPCRGEEDIEVFAEHYDSLTAKVI